MKSFLFSILICWLLLPAKPAAQESTCCKPPATSRFASLGEREKFKRDHPDPLPFHYVAKTGKLISLPVTGGKNANVFEITADKPTNRYLLVFHEWYGLNDYIKREAENLQKELGINVLALDLYDGKVAANAEDASKYMKEAKDVRIREIIAGALKHAGKNASIETIGWCFGGGWSLQASIQAGSQATGCVMFYGMPEEDLEKLKTLQAPVLGLFANKDQWITPEVVNRFLTNMKKSGKEVTIQSYTADHGFANPSNPKFNKEVAAEANALALKFLKEHLK